MEGEPTWRGQLGRITQVGLPVHEARILLEEVSGYRFAELVLHLDDHPAPSAEARLTALVSRRRAGVPLQHLLGHWPFRDLDLLVDARGLIPRPETEEVVGVALDQLALLFDGQPGGRRDRPLQVVDLGTGSGAIACALVHEFTGCEVIAIERCVDALALARENIGRLSPAESSRIALIEGSWFGPLQGREAASIDLVVANPPYVSRAEWEELEVAVRDHDPYGALVSGETGFEDLATIIRGVGEVLSSSGVLVCEIGATQGELSRSLATTVGAGSVEVLQDLAGRDRILIARFFS